MGIKNSSGCPPLGSTYLVVGVTRNCQQTLRGDIIRIKKSIPGPEESKHWLIVESDSTDKTLTELEYLSANILNFKFISEGELAGRISIREQRIAHCRNVYLNEIINNPDYKSIDYVVVADLDGLNSAITLQAFVSCWHRSDWEVCTANQVNCYYDIFALRHPLWSPVCPWKQLRYLENFDQPIGAPKAVNSLVYSKMIKISPGSPWIEVDSAFGGLAIYRKDSLACGAYSHLDEDGDVCCEHVSLHREIRNKGGRIYINPDLINAQSTEHDPKRNKRNNFWPRQLRSFVKRLNWIRQRFGAPISRVVA